MQSNKNCQALLYILGWLVIGFLSVGAFQWLIKDIDSALISVLLIAPIFIFIILSGRLSEFSAPGGWNAKFVEVASKNINTGKDSIVEIEAISQEAKGNQDNLPKALGKISRKSIRPFAIEITIGEADRYGGIPLEIWIENFLLHPNFKLVLFVDKSGAYVGHIPKESLVTLVIKGHSNNQFSRGSYQQTLEEMVSSINKNDISRLKEYSFFVSQRIFEGWSNAKALKFMIEERLDFSVVVDPQNKVKGILEKDSIIGKMILSLIDE